MTIKDIQNLSTVDMGSMTKAEIEPYLKYGKQILVNRYKAMQKRGDVSPLYKEGKDTSGTKRTGTNPTRIRTTNLTRNKQFETLRRIKELINDQTSTVSGWELWKKRQAKLFNKGETLSEDQYKKIYDAYDRLYQLNKPLFHKIDYNKIIKTLTEYTAGHVRVTEENLFKAVKKMALEQGGSAEMFAQMDFQMPERV